MKSIGKSGRHHIVFEMLGHFSFYDAGEEITRRDFISFAYDFLIQEVGLSKNRLCVTVHPEDYLTKKVWEEMDVMSFLEQEENIFVSPYANKSAFRTEILWEKPNGELMELINLVFN